MAEFFKHPLALLNIVQHYVLWANFFLNFVYKVIWYDLLA